MNDIRLIDVNALKYKNLAEVNGRLTYVLTAEEIDNAPTVELFCHYQYEGEVKEPCVEGPCPHERPHGGQVVPDNLQGWRYEETPQREWNNHTVACLLAELFGDPCACNYCGIDEWLPKKCDFANKECPDVVGVACWEQFLKHRKGGAT